MTETQEEVDAGLSERIGMEELDAGDDNEPVEAGVSEGEDGEGDELENELVEEDSHGKEKDGAERAGGEDENPKEVQGYDPPELKVEADAEAVAMGEETDSESLILSVDAGEGEAIALVPERVIDTDTRSRVQNTRAYPWRTMCSLQITARNGRRFICSGNFIGPNTVMTAGHCVYMHRNGGWIRSMKVIPGANGAAEPYGSAFATRFHTVKGWITKRSPSYDYGAVRTSTTLGRRVGWIGFAALKYLTLIRLRVNIAGYPGDKPSKTLWWTFNRIVQVAARRIYYLLDTAGGMSGAPVWRYYKGNRHQIAIHAYGGTRSNSGTRITKAVFNNMLRWRR